MAILAFEQDARLSFAARFRQIINRQNNDGASMADDIAPGAHTSRLFHLIDRDAEHWTLITDAGRQNAGFLCLRFCQFRSCQFRHDNNIRYAAPLSRKPITERTIPIIMTRKPTVAIVGAGSLATFLAVALNDAGFTITEIVARDSPRSRRQARSLAAKVGAQIVSAHCAVLDATLLWFCVPDREIRGAAAALAENVAARPSAHKKNRGPNKVPGKVPSKVASKATSEVRFAFH